jgi:hypothetical protein
LKRHFFLFLVIFVVTSVFCSDEQGCELGVPLLGEGVVTSGYESFRTITREQELFETVGRRLTGDFSFEAVESILGRMIRFVRILRSRSAKFPSFSFSDYGNTCWGRVSGWFKKDTFEGDLFLLSREFEDVGKGLRKINFCEVEGSEAVEKFISLLCEKFRFFNMLFSPRNADVVGVSLMSGLRAELQAVDLDRKWVEEGMLKFFEEKLGLE